LEGFTFLRKTDGFKKAWEICDHFHHATLFQEGDPLLDAVQEDAETWRVVEVTVGEVRNNAVEILAGLQDGDHVLGYGAILLKPSIVKALQVKE